ncbi:LOW QUALITY PROTEIN: zinc-binding protein A33-like [Chiloscyllium punctatum]|uniref:LOW QUALITY PROTEIN: zinc-binding protein A33-like n=1 Tax=Chiloscyllium punctatum TaxID=137246 RepID=UPI003B637752
MDSGQWAESWREELVCAVCLGLFVDPVTLDCGHSYCRSCITGCWQAQETNFCPECLEVFLGITLRSNRALTNLAGRVRQLNRNRRMESQQLHCELHHEGVKLLCETDQKLLCSICRDSREHRYHTFIPLNEAVGLYKDQLKSSLDLAAKRKAQLLKAKFNQEEKISQVKEQSRNLQVHIKYEFAKMHRTLSEMERCLNGDLRAREGMILEAMRGNLREIQGALDSAERVLTEFQSRLDRPDVLTILKEKDSWNAKISHNVMELVDMDLPLGIFRGPLQYIAWREILDTISPVPAALTLNPKTANPWLVLSEDQSAVRMGDRRQELPDLPQRFDRCACVLGSEGFTSGRHYWEVEVRDKTEWDLGVAKRSCKRKGRIRRTPEDGYWRLSLRGGSEYMAFTSPPTSLSVVPRPRKVGVYLDYEGGQVSFYNADSMSHLHTFTDAFTEKLYPYLCPCLNNGGKNSVFMKICGVKAHSLTSPGRSLTPSAVGP